MNYLTPIFSLNKAFLKVKLSRDQFHIFTTNLTDLITQTNFHESEEFNKNLLIRFLRNTYYQDQYLINTKNKQDLVIYHGNKNTDPVHVIFEMKKVNEKKDFPSLTNLNCKALQQLLLYYLQERIINNNLEVKHLIITNNLQWFIFDAQLFEQYFINDKALIKQFTDFSENRLSGKKTDYFYKEIAFPVIEKVKDNLIFTYIDLTEYKDFLVTALTPQPHPQPLSLVRRGELNDGDKLALEKKLIPLYKIFTPEHLLKLPFANDSNTLNKAFYSELLYIMGLTEVKEGNKKLIQREKINNRNQGSLLENALNQIKILDKLSRLEKLEDFGENEEDQLFNLGLDLVITWINRILFLKLLEAQLISYHQGDLSYSFLNLNKIKSYDDLNSLFFQVLACQFAERSPNILEKWGQIPYLNSSLFEVTELEHQTIVISNLMSENLPIFKATVLKDAQGKKLEGELNSLEYLFNFLSAYDFGESDFDPPHPPLKKGEQKTLINASVLGLIFEKINGYKDGSFFTPSFITMYMCRETIRRAVIQKFNDVKGWKCENIEDLYNNIKDKKEANTIINSLKICDPAVGSGHFLVSALNEIIAIKSELKILVDREGKTLRDYEITIANDELIIINDDGDFFEYNPHNKESQRVQETLFYEKQTIIENCLFGVDINPKSVKICQLRLWIELLKNSFYKPSPPAPLPQERGDRFPSPSGRGGAVSEVELGEGKELETLPNIDINIKCGNSLISRFSLDSDLKTVLKKNKFNISTYQNAVKTYFNAENKAQKREMLRLIATIKGNFKETLANTDPKKVKLRNLEGELYNLENQLTLIETPKEKKAREKKIIKLNNEIDLLKIEIEEIESGKLYQNAFEWRFEFPEVLNDGGDFIGFDVIIGNPPYGVNLSQNEKKYLQNQFINQDYQLDTYLLFIEQALMIMKNKAEFTYIIPNTWLSNLKFKKIRFFIINNTKIYTIAHYQKAIFEEAVVDTTTLFFAKSCNPNSQIEIRVYDKNHNFSTHFNSQFDWQLLAGETINIFLNNQQILLRNKLEINSKQLGKLFNIVIGLKPYQKGKGKPKQTESDVKNRVFDATFQVDNTYRKLLRGSDINKYSLQWKSALWLKYGENLAEPRYSANFDAEEKIVIRQTGDTLIATIDNEQFICMNNLHVITKKDDNNLSLKYLLALINSKLLDYYHYMLNPEKGEALAEVKKENVAKLPIKLINQNQQKPFIKLVEKIIKIKKNDPNADTSKLEREIDLLVYELYGLTEDEIKIVEGG